MNTETSIQTDSIMAKLKSRTAHQHQATESGVNVMSPTLTVDEYKDLLVKFYSFYKIYETKVSDKLQQISINLDYQNRLNTPRIVADLKNLGMSENEIAAIKPTDELPQIDSAEKIFGSLYVIEGSNLGGQIISRHLKEKFGFDETNGAAFFSGYGKETGKMWNEFREAITEFAENSDDEEIIGAAIETFEKIGKSLR
jgi:heme oxygenase (biliverdin-IX-beta and delta-forming)